jgi:hypothetical protein
MPAGRPSAPTLFVSAEDILSDKAIQNEVWTTLTIVLSIAEPLQCIKWLAAHRLLLLHLCYM